jgi:hypothetical protein
MTKQELKEELKVAIIELEKRCCDASEYPGRVCVYYDSCWDDDGIHCKFAKNGSCKAWKLIEKYKGEITEEELLAK